MGLLKTVPGLLISAFFLWFTFRGFKLAELKSIRLVAPIWILGLVAGTCSSYWLRSYRWWRMMRSTGARLRTCFRVFMTSLAANNILPLRLGDVMRIFTYAPDLNASPSVILSTVILEKLFDILTLVLLLVVTVRTGNGLPLKTRILVRTLLVLDAIAKIGLLGMLWIFLLSLAIWLSESLLYFSAMKMVALRTEAGAPLDWGAPLQTVSLANFAFLVPSAPGGIGTFEWASQNALKIHNVAASAAGLFGLLIHVWLLVVITGVGGSMFLAHRLHRARRKPLIEEIETLPAELP
jgi:uncharacterized membrane protein YbhN (UPF0104 family)